MSPKHRARRGAVTAAILTVLNDGPSHGYAIMDELEKRSDSRWRPSSGSLYPALGKMTHRGLINPIEGTEPQEFEITDAGRNWLNAMASDIPPPWAGRGPGHGPGPRPDRDDVHAGLAELKGAMRQIGRFGTTEQQDSADAIIAEATRRLYAVLAQEPGLAQEPAAGDPATGGPAAEQN